MLRKIFAVGSGVTALLFLGLAFMEAKAETPQAAPESVSEAAPGAAREHDRVTIFGTVWGMTLAQDGSGFYNELAADLLDGMESTAHYQLMPYRRAKARFLDSESSCIYPSAIGVLTAGEHVQDASTLVETNPLFRARTHIFARRGEHAPSNLADLKGRTIAVPSGSVMQMVLADTGADVISVFDETDKARMLLTARVDYITAMLPDAVLVFDALSEPLPAFDNELVFLESNIGFVCHRSPATEAFVEALNSRAKTLAANRDYQVRLEDAGIWHVPARPGHGAIDEHNLNDIAPAAGGSVARAHPRPTGLGSGKAGNTNY
ncbi:transporter substrate-binding domain-containing protein [Kordiimonas gwangyangensis]|uniref:transporter substrate-binding domain-containing protein n=1 Tax=Kordiimonas gwangyangensis TaxID=288022 RepID=UPI00138AC1FC|nr:transporter substrate-binding domain-containing protein [Kordiimonas gwangyangensis]